MFSHIKDVVIGTYTQLRSMVMVFSHGFRKRDTLQYPEEAVYLPPRYRGRIVLTRDPDGEERCVACNLCVNVCPVEDCITLEAMTPGQTDPRTGLVVDGDYANWTTHPNNPSATAAE